MKTYCRVHLQGGHSVRMFQTMSRLDGVGFLAVEVPVQAKGVGFISTGLSLTALH